MTHPHPLDPLTADEIRRVAGLLRRERGVDPPQTGVPIRRRRPAPDRTRGDTPVHQGKTQ